MEISEENRLEEALRLAADEPAHRPRFYELLLNSEIYILGTAGESAAEGRVNLETGSKVQIKNWEKQDGSPVIPFFSSLEVLQKSIQSEESYMALPARSLFEITLGATLVLNPKSDYGKEFLPNEIEQLLSTGLNQAPVQRVVEKEIKVLLGQPADYPSKMIDSLTQLFAKHENVKKAYLALMHDTSVDDEPHLIVGIEADGDIEKVIREAGNVASDTIPGNEPVDLYRVNENDAGISQYFINQTEPFYEKRWGGKLKSWFGIGKA